MEHRSSLVSEENLLFRKEFYVLWYSGIHPDEFRDETVAVCSITLDGGETTMIRVFDSSIDFDIHAEEKLLEWISIDPYVTSSHELEIEIIINNSPSFSFSKAFAALKVSLEDQGKRVQSYLKIVKMVNTEGDEETAVESRSGLLELYDVGVKLSPVTGKDWQYLREILRDNRGLLQQEKQCRSVRKELQQILHKPVNEETDTEFNDSMINPIQRFKSHEVVLSSSVGGE